MTILDNYRLQIGESELVPIVIGGMGVDISTSDLAVEAARFGGVGHISDAMVQWVSDRRYGSRFSSNKCERHHDTRNSTDKSSVRFNLEELRGAQLNHVRTTMDRRRGPGAIFLNVMEKLTMADPLKTLEVRLRAALDGGIDGITLSAGLHTSSLKLVEDHPRFRDAKIGIIVSSARALKIFLRAAGRLERAPDYVIVEGPLAGGHLGFGHDWQQFNLASLVKEVSAELASQGLQTPVIAAGGVFTGGDAVEMLSLGAAAVQVATRFTVTRECGLPDKVKQRFFEAREEDVVVSDLSPTGYPLRILKTSPCINSRVRPSCEAFGYVLNKEGVCPYIDAYKRAGKDENGKQQPVKDKICLCYHFARYNCYTCGQYVYRLRDTTVREANGGFRLLSAEHVFNDYRYSRGQDIALPSIGAEFSIGR